MDTELAEAQAAANAAVNKLYQRADPLALAVLEALEVWRQIADTPGHGSQQTARNQLIRWANVMDAARAMRSGLTIAKIPPGGNNGRAHSP